MSLTPYRRLKMTATVTSDSEEGKPEGAEAAHTALLWEVNRVGVGTKLLQVAGVPGPRLSLR